MEYVSFGRAGFSVSRLAFGTLTISPLQLDLKLDRGIALMKSAYDLGVTFFDTAEIYDTYAHLKHAFDRVDDVVISTKCYAYDEKTAQQSLEKARSGLGRDVIDIMMLHEQESEHTLRGHREAIDYFVNQKQKGIIRAFGVSTHFVACVSAAAEMDEIDVIHPIFNRRGLGIVDGTIEDMTRVIQHANLGGIGIFAMKPLGGGHMCANAKDALAFVADSPYVHSVAVGMQSEEEIKANCVFFSGQREKAADLSHTQKRLMIHNWCRVCGRCVDVCQHGALTKTEDKIEIDQSRCVFCGYCGAACPDFAIKVI